MARVDRLQLQFDRLFSFFRRSIFYFYIFFLFFCVKNNILQSQLENKVPIFTPPCNIVCTEKCHCQVQGENKTILADESCQPPRSVNMPVSLK